MVGFRYLYSHEYGRAGFGRAGRRGKDVKGYIFHLNNLFDLRDNNPSFDEYNKMLSCKPQTLTSKLSIDFNLLISLMYTGNNEFERFMKNSMLSNEVGQQELSIKGQCEHLKEMYNQKVLGFQHIKTSKEIMTRYYELQNTLEFASKKKKRTIQSEMTNISSDKFFEKDFKYFMEWIDMSTKIVKLENDVKNTQNYFNNEISLHLDILKHENYINDDFTLTEKGKICANIHEIHSQAMTDAINDGIFNDLSCEEIVSVLSIFTPIRLSDDDKYHNVSNINCNDKIINAITNIKKN